MCRSSPPVWRRHTHTDRYAVPVAPARATHVDTPRAGATHRPGQPRAARATPERLRTCVACETEVALFGSAKRQMIEADEALPGRPAYSYRVPETHEVLGTPLQGPWP